MFSRFSLKSVLLTLGLLMIPVFGYVLWSSPDTLDTVMTKYPGVGGGVKQDFQSLPTLPLTEEKDSFTLKDNTSDGIDIQFANQSEVPLLGTESPRLNLAFPKDYSQPIVVKLDDKRTVNITDLSGKSDYEVETLGQEVFQTQPENSSFLQKFFPKKEKTPQIYLRYTSDDGRKSLLYAYQKDQASGEKKLKHWTLYENGDGIEQESYRIENAKVKVNSEGVVEVFYYTEQDLKNDQAATEVDSNLLARAQRTLAREMGEDLLNGNKTPDFTIPKPYYIDSVGEKHDAEWRWSDETNTLSVSFSPTSYPVALDPTLSFTAPGVSNGGSVITGEPTGAQGSALGIAMASGDFNADGKMDLAVGANTFGLTYEGRVYLFYNDGSYAPVANAADVVIHDSTGYTRFGTAVAAGDVNGDGKTDLIASTDLYDTSTTGAVKIFYNDGSYPTTASGADVTITGEASTNFGGALRTGDFNFDGKVDLVVGAQRYSSVTGRAYIFYNDGSIPTTAGTADVIINGNATGDAFGSSFATGDVNSDGRTDLIIGAVAYSSSTGRAYIFYNDGSIPTAAGSADVTITGENVSDGFSGAMTTGDFDADGKTDLASSATSYSSYTGRAYIFYGDGSIPTTAATADVKITSSSALDELGRSLGSGDMNADGRVDLIVGAGSYFNTAGRVYVFYNDGSIPTTTASADVTITGEGGGYFGTSLATGDFNTDGRADLAVGAIYAAGNAGRTYFFYSQNGQVSTNRNITGEAATDNFTYALTTGEWNADGRADLAVGAYGYSSETGRVYIFYGDGQVPTTAATADIIMTGNATGDRFGWALTAGDYNADGRADIAVGAPVYSTSTGRTYVFYGGSIITEGASGADVTITGETTSNNFGTALVSGDFNADSKTDIAVAGSGYDTPATDTGRAYIFYNGAITTENASGADVTINGENSGNFGVTMIAGDFNGSGTTDLMVSGYGSGNAGRIYLFYNDASYPSGGSTADVLIVGENSGDFMVATGAGDFNADGKIDIAAGSSAYSSNTGRAYVFYADGTNNFGTVTCSGSSPSVCSATDADVKINGETTNNEFATAIAADLNADGRTDLVVGAYRYGSFDGRVYVFFNDGSYPTTASSADIILGGDVGAGSYFGSTILTVDMNGDGRSDLVVGARGYNTGQGRLYFYETRENFAWQIQRQPTSSGITRTSLSTAGQEIQITGQTSSFFGVSLTTGDFNADGKKDLAVGANAYASSTGRVYIFYSDGDLPTSAASADVVIVGGATTDEFGGTITAGDFNADGKTDLAVSSYMYSNKIGRVYVFYNDGSYPATANSADVIFTGDSILTYFGWSLAAGDFNADGTIDLAVGAYKYASSAGRIYIFYNDGSYPAPASADVIIAGEASSRLGTSLVAGDFNADGETDIASGAQGYSSFAGRVYIFHNDGSIPTTAATADVIITGEASSELGDVLVAGDFNFDSTVDLASSAINYSSSTGRAYIFHNDGSIPTTAATADVIITGETASDSFSWSLTSGDWNADGRTDLAVGALGYSSSAGRVYIFNNDGSIPTTGATADIILTGEASSTFGYVLNSGDFNADGKTDLVISSAASSAGRVSIHTFNDPVITGETVFSEFAYAMAAGDLNADGRTDLVVGAWAYTTNTGRVYLFYNDGIYPSAAASADVIMTGEATTNYFGAALATGDFNTDGKVDLVVGASRYSSATGRSYIFYNDGSYPTAAGSADVILNGDQYFGSALAAGDFNADGRVDVAVGAYNYGSGAGRAYIFHNDGSYPAGATTADVIISGEASSQFGNILVSDDLNADGETDLAIGASAYSSATGRAYIFNNDGSIPTTAATADVIITGETTSNNFGLSMATGDFNTDGKTDLAVGASGYSSSTGRVYIFNNDGSLPTTAATADSMITGEATSNSFATSLASGDLSADGRADLIVGASYTSGRGRAYIFYNDGALPSAAASADMIHTGTATFSGFGIAMAIGDWNVDGKMDLAVGADAAASNGRVYILSSEVAPTSSLPGTFYMKGTGKLKGTGTIK